MNPTHVAAVEQIRLRQLRALAQERGSVSASRTSADAEVDVNRIGANGMLEQMRLRQVEINRIRAQNSGALANRMNPTHAAALPEREIRLRQASAPERDLSASCRRGTSTSDGMPVTPATAPAQSSAPLSRNHRPPTLTAAPSSISVSATRTSADAEVDGNRIGANGMNPTHQAEVLEQMRLRQVEINRMRVRNSGTPATDHAQAARGKIRLGQASAPERDLTASGRSATTSSSTDGVSVTPVTAPTCTQSSAPLMKKHRPRAPTAAPSSTSVIPEPLSSVPERDLSASGRSAVTNGMSVTPVTAPTCTQSSAPLMKKHRPPTLTAAPSSTSVIREPLSSAPERDLSASGRSAVTNGMSVTPVTAPTQSSRTAPLSQIKNRTVRPPTAAPSSVSVIPEPHSHSHSTLAEVPSRSVAGASSASSSASADMLKQLLRPSGGRKPNPTSPQDEELRLRRIAAQVSHFLDVVCMDVNRVRHLPETRPLTLYDVIEQHAEGKQLLWRAEQVEEQFTLATNALALAQMRGRAVSAEVLGRLGRNISPSRAAALFGVSESLVRKYVLQSYVTQQSGDPSLRGPFQTLQVAPNSKRKRKRKSAVSANNQQEVTSQPQQLSG